MSYPIVILGSGRGTNAEALLQSESKKRLGVAKIAAVISDHQNAGILALGEKYKVPAIFLDPGRKGARLSDEAEQVYIERIQSLSPELIILAGFMRILKRPFIDAFKGRVINLHPSLLPSFPGMSSIQQAYEYGVRITGCSIHWVTPELDAGPIIDQKVVRIEESDTLESLTKKVHIAEHALLPDVVTRLSKSEISTP